MLFPEMEYDVRVVGYPHDPKPAPMDGSHFPAFWMAESRKRKSETITTDPNMFLTCVRCKRLLHNSVLDHHNVCYSCGR